MIDFGDCIERASGNGDYKRDACLDWDAFVFHGKFWGHAAVYYSGIFQACSVHTQQSWACTKACIELCFRACFGHGQPCMLQYVLGPMKKPYDACM